MTFGPSEFAGRIRDLTDALTDADNRYDERVGELENEIAELRDELLERATTIATLQGRIAGLEQRNQALRDELGTGKLVAARITLLIDSALEKLQPRSPS